MARYGSGDDENYYSDDDATQLSNYGQGGYAHDDQAGYDQPAPWYRKPAALVAFGAVGAVILALIIFGLAKAITGDSPSEPTTASLTPVTSSSAPAVTSSSAAEETTGTSTETTAATTTPTTTTPTTTETTAPTTTTTTTTQPSTSVSTSTSTVTQTETQTQTVTQSSAPPPTP
ncbi:hypothetical protein FK535_26910 [Mycolicibacterium sp. 018/SC-01/001]|uniref:hypothetical protein n=1 Tax=Mycolicibacterium sp. 018/SC-01/001 TaxID=2592069 RepID=UPI001181616F|nr:hypothetical protein [Mycolicibacterium sp. 018/SC-01/001]TRW77253.1 hypothetical protein FK535_26910 [Mycolicibacterium sp. 018/SC-01/001]